MEGMLQQLPAMENHFEHIGMYRYTYRRPGRRYMLQKQHYCGTSRFSMKNPNFFIVNNIKLLII
jgi:hypothetical protein